MAKAYSLTPSYILGFVLTLLLCTTARADNYVVVVGSYANDSNAQQAQTKVANYLRQSGIVAQTQIIESAGRLRVAVLALEQPSQSLLRRLRQGPYKDAWRLKTKRPTTPVNAVAAQPLAVPQAPTMARKQAPSRATATPVQARVKARSLRKPKPIAQPMEFDARIKGFALAADLPGNDWQRQSFANPTTDFSGDLRLMLNKTVGSLQFQLHHSSLLQAGDTVQWGQGAVAQVDQMTATDAHRLLDMTWQTDSGRRHQWGHRIDRMSVQWQQADWSVTLGRQAVSWGSGIVFQPLDPFNPFAPTAVDRDYKNGDDLVLIERLLPNGHDLQVLHVMRRDERQQLRSRVSSTAAKWHGYLFDSEFELIAASHYDQDFVGLSIRQPVGPAVVRTDLAWREGLQSGDRWRLLGIVNADVAFPIRDRMAYVFAEYFYNDFGMQSMPGPLGTIPQQLETALLRGEVFNLMREYLAVGASYQWHPLLTQSLSVISNLSDGSALLQGQLSIDSAQNQQLQFGFIGGYADPGDEFAPLPAALSPQGELLTQGGSDRYYLRWAWYF
jgi:hypothetical protein